MGCHFFAVAEGVLPPATACGAAVSACKRGRDHLDFTRSYRWSGCNTLLVELCTTKAQFFCIKCRWTLNSLNDLPFLTSTFGIWYWEYSIILTYPCFVKNQAAGHQKDGAWRPPKRFGHGTFSPNKRMNLPRASLFFWRRTSFLGVYARSRQLGFTFGALRHPFILDGRWSLAASHCNLGSVAGEEGAHIENPGNN